MGRTKKNTVYRHFQIDETMRTSTCLIDECGKVLKKSRLLNFWCHVNTYLNESDLTLHGSNLLKHLQHKHPDQFKLTTEINTTIRTIPIQRADVTESIMKECTNLVTIHGRPFSLIDDDAFQNILKLIPNNNVAINAHKIRSNIESMAEKLRFEMGTTLQGKCLCLKVDIASIATRCFLGINCQYIEDGHIILKNLAVTEIFQRHTSDHLKDLLLLNLQRFRIDLPQIYSITTDNGANMIKMTKLVNQANSNVIILDTAEAGPSSSQINNSLGEDSGSESESHQNVDDIHDIERMTNTLTENLGAQFHNIEGELQHDEATHSIGLVRCAAHTLQLALQDASNSIHTRTLILECREVVRRLRTPQFVRVIRQANKSIPKLDCTTRWHSTIDMVQSLLSLREICASHDRLILPSTTWTALDDYVQCMTPAKILTKKLQEEQLTVGDFYLEWSLCTLKLGKMHSEIATCIMTKMKERESSLFCNNIFTNAIFLDPRVNSILTPIQVRQAKDNLIRLFFNYFKIEHKDTEANSMESNATITETTEARADLDDFLNAAYINRLSDLTRLLTRDDPRGDLINNLQQTFNLFLDEPLLKSTESILMYWEKAKLKFPLLYKLSRIVLATPMTQVSVERLFSSLRFIVSNYRLSMKDQVIDDILFLRSNSIFEK